jgi:hypothetical protein
VARRLLSFDATVSPSTPPQAGRSVAVGLFEREPQARQAVHALRGLGVDDRQVGVLVPGRDVSTPAAPAADVNGLLAVAASAGDVSNVLLSMGVPEGEARFYAQEVQSGRTLVVVDANSNYHGARTLLLRHGGYDVQSRGGDLAAAENAGVPGGTGARPVDVTGVWEDVASRYEMLWGQHYGTTDATWDQVAPIYRYAWHAANDPRFRGRPWSEVERAVRADWESSNSGLAWSDVAGPIHDVFQDVAEEAAMAAEGGGDRRIARQGTDQSVAAREVVPPDRPTG